MPSFNLRFSRPFSVARAVMERCPHNVLTSDGARLFAEKEGFPLDPTITNCVVNIRVCKWWIRYGLTGWAKR